MELGSFVQRAALAGDLRGCHSRLGRPPRKSSGNDSRPCGLNLSALGGVERAEHPDEEPAPLGRGFCLAEPNVRADNGSILPLFSENNGLMPVAHHPSKMARPTNG